MNDKIKSTDTNKDIFIYDLYDYINHGKRILNDILESIEERTKEGDVTDSIVFDITIEAISQKILWITYNNDGCNNESDELIENIKNELLIERIKNELLYSLNSTLPYEGDTPIRSIEYINYDKSMSYIIDLYLNDKDITKSEYYDDVLYFLIKKTYIRGV